jgi:hypothetical protein
VSVVAGKVYSGGGFGIAADSIQVRWPTQVVGLGKFTKLWDEGPLVIGTVGTCEEGGLMRLFSMNHQPHGADVRSITEYLGEFGAWKKTSTESGKVENHSLLGWRGRLFHCEGLFADEIAAYDAIGAGQDFALAALYLGHSPIEAVEAATALSTLCQGPSLFIERGPA